MPSFLARLQRLGIVVAGVGRRGDLLNPERRLGGFAGRADAVIFSSGYMANLAALSTLVGADDFILAVVTQRKMPLANLVFDPGSGGRGMRDNLNRVSEVGIAESEERF